MPDRLRIPLRPLSVVVAALVATAACGTNSDAAGCTERREPPDPQSVLHVVDPDGVTYRTDPPTSGPHVGVAAPAGVQDTPLPPVLQVRVLEAGGVVVQYTDELDPGTVAALVDMVGDDERLVVAPGGSLPAPVVATAWTWKLTCPAPTDDGALAALTARIAEFAERSASAPGVD